MEYARATDAEIIASGSGTGAQARVNIMGRIAELARLNLAAVNAGFPPQRLREIELVLFSTARGADEQQRALLLQLTREAFPHLEEESLRRAVEP